MAKSKKKSLIIRFAQQDYEFLSSRPSSSLAPWTLSRLDMQDSQAPSRASTPPRTKMAFADAVDFSHGARFARRVEIGACRVHHLLFIYRFLLSLVGEM